MSSSVFLISVLRSSVVILQFKSSASDKSGVDASGSIKGVSEGFGKFCGSSEWNVSLLELSSDSGMVMLPAVITTVK